MQSAKKTRTNYKVILGLLISISLIFYLFYKIDIKNVLSVIQKFNPNIIVLLLLIYIIGMFLRTIRWKLIIEQNDKINIILIFKALVLGYMINNLIPAKMGELARVEYLKRTKGLRRSFLFGTIMIERSMDVLLVITFLAFSLIFSQSIRNVFAYNQWIIYLLLFVVLFFIYFMLKPNSIKWFFRFLPNKLKKKLGNITDSFTTAILFINNKQFLFSTIIYSLMIWCLTLISVYLILKGLSVTLPFYAYFFIIAAGVLGMVIPSTSGGIGVYHAIATGSLLVFGVEPATALTFSIISHSIDFFPGIILGGILFGFGSLNIVKSTEYDEKELPEN